MKYEVTIKISFFELSDHTSEQKKRAIEKCLTDELCQLEGVDVISVDAVEVRHEN